MRLEPNLKFSRKDDRRKRCSTCWDDTWELFGKPNKKPFISRFNGGIQYVTLSDDEAKRRGTQKYS
jgi:hypothetical protein